MGAGQPTCCALGLTASPPQILPVWLISDLLLLLLAYLTCSMGKKGTAQWEEESEQKEELEEKTDPRNLTQNGMQPVLT